MRPSALRIALALAALTGPAAAQPLSAGTAEPGCGGDAFSSAEVVENKPPRRGPLVAVPQTLCADVAPQPGTPTTQIDVYPMITPEIGPGGGGIPYGGGSYRPYRP
ncbi:hypothetical protein SAMN02799622_01589 [Methylobacterium sp. UNC378MF]|uniref:hypothetical protein n=1 Tax=unclassified Methylobacterium TaxID=2615210 RepID=UPI00088F1795|nr:MULTISPECIES: hypothetical protein [unclassified Methylobacterium]KAA0124606.1 hypothetical protein CIW48_07555 [Methylobacterium sp. P1-11]SDA16453.1 hypothetical protein SAMN02799622_01589 [Methylobacterium sp. UNC378MF]